MLEADLRARDILEEWASLQGHDLCWWYPEFIQPLADIYGLSLEGIMLTPQTPHLFHEGCARFRREQYSKEVIALNLRGGTAREILAEWIECNRGKEMTYHDEIIRRLARRLDVEIPSTPNVSESELQEGCIRFQLTQYKT